MSTTRAAARPIALYIAVNALVAAAILWTSAGELDEAGGIVLLVWLIANLAAEWFWLESITGQGMHSMASTFNFATIYLLPRAEATWVIALAVLLGALTFQRRAWYRALFVASNVAIVVFVASTVFTSLGGVHPALEGFWDPGQVAPFLASGVAFFLLNTFGVAGAIALSERQGLLFVWRENFAAGFEMLGTVALFLISPIVVLAYLAAGAPALVLFALPLLLIRKGNRDTIELRRTQASVVAAERLAAKGEMAAGIAHELNNYLAALRGGTQLMERQLRSSDVERVEKRLGLIREQVDNMAILTRGLMEFAHRDVSLARTDVADLVRRTVAFLSPQRRFGGLSIEVTEMAPVEILVDAAQIQQVLVNLLNNAADALGESEGSEPVIRVGLVRERRHVRLSVSDGGSGMPEAVKARIFEPTFTTKPDGHGFGLATCQRIAANHGGKLLVESTPGVGTTMTLVLPVREHGRARVNRRDAKAPREPDADTDRSRSREA